MLFLHRVRRMKGMQVIEFRAKNFRWNNEQRFGIADLEMACGLKPHTAVGITNRRSLIRSTGYTLSLLEKKDLELTNHCLF